jgi:hypothetical protein
MCRYNEVSGEAPVDVFLVWICSSKAVGENRLYAEEEGNNVLLLDQDVLAARSPLLYFDLELDGGLRPTRQPTGAGGLQDVGLVAV